MSHDKYSVLFMRDDRRVKRFRVSPFWIKTFVYFITILSLSAAGGITASVYLWRASAGLRLDNRGLTGQLNQAQIQLERLQNVEKILQSNDPEELQALLGSVSSPPPSATPPAPPAPSVDLAELLGAVNRQQVAIDNLRLSLANGSAKIQFELNNLQPNQTLDGQIELLFVLKNGKTVAPQVNTQELAFSIQRFKTIRASAGLQGDLNVKDIYALRLSIKDAGGNVIYSEAYPLTRILA
jgi:hypothetical protein